MGGDGSIYLQSRMMGSDTKVSFHTSGQCQFSYTSEWVRKDSGCGLKNADRHIAKWDLHLDRNNSSLSLFRLIVPSSELRSVHEKNVQKVRWLAAPLEGQALAVEMYFSPPMANQPAPHQFAYHPLVVWPLPGQRWFVALHHAEEITPENACRLSEARHRIAQEAQRANITLLPQYRAVALFENHSGTRGVIEVIPFDGSSEQAPS